MKRIITMGLLSAVLGLFGCNAHNNDQYESVDVERFAEVIADTTVVRLDVRTPEEYAEGHILGAINIDVLESDFASKVVTTIPMESTVALYCRSGRRSKRAAGILADKGYKVIELNTGYIGWVKSRKVTN